MQVVAHRAGDRGDRAGQAQGLHEGLDGDRLAIVGQRLPGTGEYQRGVLTLGQRQPVAARRTETLKIQRDRPILAQRPAPDLLCLGHPTAPKHPRADRLPLTRRRKMADRRLTLLEPAVTTGP